MYPPSPKTMRPPVFVVGSARSGNTLLYHILLSSGHFAVYRGEPAVFDLLVPRFGPLSRRKNREKLMSAWLRSSMFRISGLEAESVRDRILNECTSAGDFLRLIMDQVARLQGKDRWAVWGPDNLLYMLQIKKEIPNALFIHTIRDGRDVAFSMGKERWIRPFPWDRKEALTVAALHWKWKVSKGIRLGSSLSPDYLEIRFENLVTRRAESLQKVSQFIGQEINSNEVRKHSVGTLTAPNSTFKAETESGTFQPIGRWQRHLSQGDVKVLDSVIGTMLADLGYPRAFPQANPPSFRHRLMQQLYPLFFDTKQWLKGKNLAGAWVSVDRMNLLR